MKRWMAWLLIGACCLAGLSWAEEAPSAREQALLSALAAGLEEGYTVTEPYMGDLYGEGEDVLCAVVEREGQLYLALLQHEDAPVSLKGNLLLGTEIAQSVEIYIDNGRLFIRQDGGAPDAPWTLLLAFALIEEESMGLAQMASGQTDADGAWTKVNPTLTQLTLTVRTADDTGEHVYAFDYLDQSYTEVEWPDEGGEKVYADLGLEPDIVPPDYETYDVRAWPMMYTDLLGLFDLRTEYGTQTPALVELLQYGEDGALRLSCPACDGVFDGYAALWGHDCPGAVG